MPSTKAQNAAIKKNHKFCKFRWGHYSPCERPPMFYRACSYSPPSKPSNCLLNGQNQSRCFRVMWVQRKSRSAGYIPTRASTGLVVNHCALAVSPNVYSRGTWHVTRGKFSLSPTVLELGAEICSNDRQTITIRWLVFSNKWHYFIEHNIETERFFVIKLW